MKRTSILCYHIYFDDKYVYGIPNYISVIIQFETFNYNIIIINNILILCAANGVSIPLIKL